MKKENCRKNEVLTPREKCIALLQAMSKYQNEEFETWKGLPGNDNYLVSSWCRLKSLRSFGGKSRVLSPSMKGGKYLYYTVNLNGSRKSISITKLKKLHTNNNYS